MRPCLLLGLIVLHSACAHSASSAPPATVNKIAAQGTAAARDEQRSASDRARGLYEILMRLAQDPAAQAKLAPAARLIFHGEETTDEALTDVYGELRWVRESELPLVTDAESKSASEESFVHCAAAELQCVIVQPGGETTFRFVQIVEGGERRVVLSSIESAEP